MSMRQSDVGVAAEVPERGRNVLGCCGVSFHGERSTGFGEGDAPAAPETKGRQRPARDHARDGALIAAQEGGELGRRDPGMRVGVVADEGRTSHGSDSRRRSNVFAA